MENSESTTNNLVKMKKREVKLEDGQVLKLTVIDLKAEGPETLICNQCSYRNICSEIPDPNCPDDKDRSLIDFCGELGTAPDEDADLINAIPAPGSLERVFEGKSESVFKALINKNPLVHLQDVISKVCSGWCDDYDEEFTKCNECNSSCMLHDLFMGKEKLIGDNLKKIDEKELESLF